MYVRIARFEGAGDNWDERVGEIRERMASGRGGSEGPPIKRALMLVEQLASAFGQTVNGEIAHRLAGKRRGILDGAFEFQRKP